VPVGATRSAVVNRQKLLPTVPQAGKSEGFYQGQERKTNRIQNRFGRLTRRLPQALAARLRPTAPATPSAVFPLQVYPGYADSDLDVIHDFFTASPEPEPGFILDRLGVRTRGASLWDGAQSLVGAVIPPPVPADYHAEAIEWIGLLKSVRAASDRFVAMELGAGWGPWLVAGATAARRCGIETVRLLGVEADPVHFEALRRHFTDNGLAPEAHTLLRAAVGAVAGHANWPRVADPRNDWGLCPVAGEVSGDTIDVDVLAVAGLLDREPVWDLVHIDVQGGEADLLAAAPSEFDGRVRWLVIGTHSRTIEGDLLAMLPARGWVLEHEKPCRFAFQPGAPSLATMTTCDGTQVWRNGRLGL
jgi:FkbM family methyltransferase